MGGSQFDVAGEVYEASAGMPFREHLELPSVRSALGDLDGLAAVDLGCGTGLYARRMARWGARSVVGSDVSEGMLRAARTAEAQRPRGIEYLRHDLTTGAGVGDGRADVALAVYVLCYAGDVEALAGMCRAARATLRPGGRLVALTLNPDYVDDAELPGYYSPYGFTLTGDARPPVEGSAVRLDVAPFADAPAVSVRAAWWSADAYDAALHEAGFDSVSWQDMRVDPSGVDELGEAFWTDYLACPHARVVSAR